MANEKTKTVINQENNQENTNDVTKEKQPVETTDTSEKKEVPKSPENEEKKEGKFEWLRKLLEELMRLFGRGSIGKQIEDLKKDIDKLATKQDETTEELAGFLYNVFKEFSPDREFFDLTEEDIFKKTEELKVKEAEIRERIEKHNRCKEYKGTVVDELKRKGIKDCMFCVDKNTGEFLVIDTTDINNITARAVTIEVEEGDEEGKVHFHPATKIQSISEYTNDKKYFCAKTTLNEETEVENNFKLLADLSTDALIKQDTEVLEAISKSAEMLVSFGEKYNWIQDHKDTEDYHFEFNFKENSIILTDNKTDLTAKVYAEGKNLVFEGYEKNATNLRNFGTIEYFNDEKATLDVKIPPEYVSLFASEEMNNALSLIDNGARKQIEKAIAEQDMGVPLTKSGLERVKETRNELYEISDNYDYTFRTLKQNNKVVHSISESVTDILKAEIRYTPNGYVASIKTAEEEYDMLHGVPENIKDGFVKEIVDILDEKSLLRDKTDINKTALENANKEFKEAHKHRNGVEER